MAVTLSRQYSRIRRRSLFVLRSTSSRKMQFLIKILTFN